MLEGWLPHEPLCDVINILYESFSHRSVKSRARNSFIQLLMSQSDWNAAHEAKMRKFALRRVCRTRCLVELHDDVCLMPHSPAVFHLVKLHDNTYLLT